MLTLNATKTIDFRGLDAELRATVSGFLGLVYDGALVRALIEDGSSVFSDYAHDAPALVGNAAAQATRAIIDAHDPVFITIAPSNIAANGVDAATITVTTVRPAPAPVILLIGGTEVPITLVNGGDSVGVGSVSVTSVDAATIPIALKDGAFRNPAVSLLQAFSL